MRHFISKILRSGCVYGSVCVCVCLRTLELSARGDCRWPSSVPPFVCFWNACALLLGAKIPKILDFIPVKRQGNVRRERFASILNQAILEILIIYLTNILFNICDIAFHPVSFNTAHFVKKNYLVLNRALCLAAIGKFWRQNFLCTLFSLLLSAMCHVCFPHHFHP